MNSFASHSYMKYVYMPEDEMDDDVCKIMHTIRCQVTGDIVWHDTHHSPYRYMSRVQFVQFIDDKLLTRAEEKSRKTS